MQEVQGLPFTEAEINEVLDAVERLGSQVAAAKELGMSRAAVQRRVYAANEDDFLTNSAGEAGFPSDKVKAYWAKTETGSFYVTNERDPRDIMAEIKEALASDMPQAPAIHAPKSALNADLLNCFVIADYHLAMMAWAEETRSADWDLHIAEDLLIKWFERAIAQSPDAEECVFMQLADFLHWDSMQAVTPANRHILDGDTRAQKMIRVAIRVMRKVIDMLLTKHAHVYLYNLSGNHDEFSGAVMREFWYAFYENEPRVTIDRTPDLYHVHEFGDVSLFMHHGHKRNLKNIDHVFASRFREIFGRTKYSYGHVGHLHSQVVMESNLMKLEQHPTLAPEDAYASHGGWGHKREARVITYHKRFGEVSRLTISPEMVQ